jgi:hypothetical protein
MQAELQRLRQQAQAHATLQKVTRQVNSTLFDMVQLFPVETQN